MPIVSDDMGRLAIVPEGYLYAEHPSDFLDAQVYKERLELAKRKVLGVVLSLHKGELPNDSVYLKSHQPSDFANFIDGIDGARSR